MNTKSKVLTWFFLAVFALVAIWNFETLIRKHNFVVNTHIACDSSKNSCFITTCDVASGEDCSEEVYAKLEKNASTIPLCDKFKEECPELTCESGEVGCVITYCSADTIEEESGESCVGPDAPEEIVPEIPVDVPLEAEQATTTTATSTADSTN